MYCIRQTLISAPDVIHISKNVKQALLSLSDDLLYTDEVDAHETTTRTKTSRSTNRRVSYSKSPVRSRSRRGTTGDADAQLSSCGESLRQHVTALSKVHDPTRFARIIDCLGDIVTALMCRVQHALVSYSGDTRVAPTSVASVDEAEPLFNEGDIPSHTRVESSAMQSDTQHRANHESDCTVVDDARGSSPVAALSASLSTLTSSSSASRILVQRVHAFATAAASHNKRVPTTTSPARENVMIPTHEHQQPLHQSAESSSVVCADSASGRHILDRSQPHADEQHMDYVAAAGAAEQPTLQTNPHPVAQLIGQDNGVLHAIIRQMVRHSCCDDVCDEREMSTSRTHDDAAKAKSRSPARRTQVRRSSVQRSRGRGNHTRRIQASVRRCARVRKTVSRSYVFSRKANRYVPAATRGFYDDALPSNARRSVTRQR